MIQGPQDIKVLVLDDYEGFAASVPSYEKVKALAQVVILQPKVEKTTPSWPRHCTTCKSYSPSGNAPSSQRVGAGSGPQIHLSNRRGIGHLDLPAATRRKIAVCLTGRETPVSTIELTMALILSCLRKIPLVSRRMREEAWPPIPGYLLARKTVGIVGLGRIGKRGSSLMFGVQRASFGHWKNPYG